MFVMKRANTATPGWRMTRSSLPAIAACCLLVTGCGDSKNTERIDAARKFLQLDKPQEALNAFESGDSKVPADAHYLKALAFDRLERHDAAMTEIDAAIATDAKNPNYRGLKMRLRLFQKDRDAVDELIDLHKQNSSSAALSVFVVYAYQAKMARLYSQQKVRAADVQNTKATEALKTVVALLDEVPELHPEILEFAITLGLVESAQKIVTKLLELDPNDAVLQQQKVSISLLANDADEAIRAAKELYRIRDRNAESATVYASVLSNQNTKASSANDTAFQELVERYPLNTSVIGNYAVYLARSNRLTQACEFLQAAIERQKQSKPRSTLISMTISLPLEAGATELAAQQLARYRSQMDDALMVIYLEGRILFLKKQHDQALVKMAQVIQAQKQELGGSRSLAIEALQWTKQILADKLATMKLQSAANVSAKQSKPTDSKDTKPPKD